MSFTVIVKDNDNGKIVYASEKAKAVVLGAVGKGQEEGQGGISFACGCGSPVDMIIAIGQARQAIDAVEKKVPSIKFAAPLAQMLIEKQAEKQAEEDEKDGN